MSENCPFCRIVAGETTAKIIYQDDLVTAFEDVQPAAPVHVLIVPNRHITSLNRITPEDEGLLGRLLIAARKLAEQYNISQDGYRLQLNTGEYAGQTVFHLHLHLLGGARLPAFTR